MLNNWKSYSGHIKDVQPQTASFCRGNRVLESQLYVKKLHMIGQKSLMVPASTKGKVLRIAAYQNTWSHSSCYSFSMQGT